MASFKLLMFKLAVLAVSPDFVEIVHVELNQSRVTWRTKLEKFECLK